MGSYRSACHSISGSAPPPQASRDAQQRNTAVTNCRSTCLMHGEAKQHTSDFGAEKGLTLGPRAGSHNCNRGRGEQDPSGSYSANSRQHGSPVQEAAVTLGCSLWDPAPVCTTRGAWGLSGSWAPGSLSDDGWAGPGGLALRVPPAEICLFSRVWALVGRPGPGVTWTLLDGVTSPSKNPSSQPGLGPRREKTNHWDLEQVKPCFAYRIC